MNRCIVCIFSLLFVISPLFSQTYQPAVEETYVFSNGEKPVLKVIIEDVNKDFAEKALSEYLKNYKGKLSTVKGVEGEYYTNEPVTMDKAEQKPVSVRAKILQVENRTTLYLHYAMTGTSVGSVTTPLSFESFRHMTNAIASKAVVYQYDQIISKEENVLNDLEKELKNLEKDREKEKDNIYKAESEIKDSELNIASLENEMKWQQQKVSDKAKEVSDKETEIARMDVKELEKEIKSIEKENEGIQKEIDKVYDNIAKESGTLASEEAQLELLEKEIYMKQALSSDDKKVAKEIKSLESDRIKQIEAIEKIRVGIDVLNHDIATKQTGINNNTSKINSIEEAIRIHNEDALKEQLKLLEKELKSLEGDVDKTQKSIEKEQSNINKQKEIIYEKEKEVEKLTQQIEAKNKEIDAQKAHITSIQKLKDSY